MKIHKATILPVAWVWNLVPHTVEERRLRMFENRVLRRMCETKREAVTGGGEDYIRGSLMICTPHHILFG